MNEETQRKYLKETHDLLYKLTINQKLDILVMDILRKEMIESGLSEEVTKSFINLLKTKAGI